MHEVSLVRLYLLRATFLLIILGMGPNIWTLILQSSGNVEHMRGVVWSVLGAVSLLAVLGLRYPLKMLPLLFVELTWKTIWILAIGLPLWSAGRLDEATRETWNACLMGLVVFAVAIPWGYVWTRYVREPGDRWTRGILPVPPAEQVRT
jgi:hypothetical protein